jgi:hypothetical protein
MRVLRAGAALHPLPVGRRLRTAALRAAHLTALHAANFDAAAEAAAELAALTRPAMDTDVEARVEAGEAAAAALLAGGHLTEAATLATQLASTCLSAGLHAPHVRVLLLLGQVGTCVLGVFERELHCEGQ